MADAVAANAAQNAAAAAPAQPAQAPVGEAVLAKLPEKLQNLTRPVVVTGTVIGETPDGLTRVRTAAGEVQMQSPTPLPADKPVTLQIPAGSPPPKAIVLAQPTAAPAAAAAAAASNSPAAAPPSTGNAATGNAPPQTAAAALLQTATPLQTATQAAVLPPVGALISAVVLAANPKPIAVAAALSAGLTPTAAPQSKSDGAATGKEIGKDGGANGGKTDAAGLTAGGAAPRAGLGPTSGTQGEPVALGGDAAHRGTMLDPPPSGGKPAPPNNQNPNRQDADNQTQNGQAQNRPPPQGAPATPKSPAEALNGAAIMGGDKTDGDKTGGRNPTPSPPPPTDAPQAKSAQTSSGQTSSGPNPTPEGAASGRLPPRPTVGLTDVRDFAAAPAKPPTQTVQPQTAQPQTAARGGETSPVPPFAAPPSPAPAPAPPETPPLQPGRTLAFKVAATALPSPTGVAPPPLAADNDDGSLLEGAVAGATPQGKPILAVRDGMLALNTDVKLPLGARLALQWLDPTALAAERPPPIDGAAVDGGLPDYLQGRDFPAIKAALSALRDMDPVLVQHLLTAATPQPNRKLGATLTFLISAMRGGDARGWLGADAARALRDGGKEKLLQNLEQEFAAVERQTAEKLPDDWRGVTLPFYDQTGVNPMHLYVHPFPDPEPEKEKPAAAKGTRFVLDVELSRFGPLQLDGMVKPPQFDLIMRSKAALPPDLRQELRGVFADCLAAVGFAGGLTFQSDLRAWVRLSRAGSAGPAISA